MSGWAPEKFQLRQSLPSPPNGDHFLPAKQAETIITTTRVVSIITELARGLYKPMKSFKRKDKCCRSLLAGTTLFNGGEKSSLLNNQLTISHHYPHSIRGCHVLHLLGSVPCAGKLARHLETLFSPLTGTNWYIPSTEPNLQRLMAVYVTEPTSEQEFIYSLLNHISGISYYISAVVNPILYR